MTPEASIDTFVYTSKSPVGFKPALCLLGAIMGFGLGAILFFVVLVFHLGGDGHGVALVLPPVFIGIACASYGFILIRSPQTVEISPSGIEIETVLGTKSIPWSEIDRVEQDKTLVYMTAQTYRQIVLFNRRGRRRAAITELIEDFDDLVSQIKSAVGEHSTQPVTSGPMRRSKRNGVIFLVLGITCFIAYPWPIVNQVKARASWQQLEASGVGVDAKIERRYFYNNIAPRIEYSFEDAQGNRHTRDTILLKPAWDRLPSTGTVPVRYLRDDPEFNRIKDGEEDEKSEKGIERIVIGLVGVVFMGGLFTVGGILQFMGIDITMDDKTGRIRIKRLDDFAGSTAGSASKS